MTHPLGLSDSQLGLLFAAAALIEQHDRSGFLNAFADRLSSTPNNTDNIATTLALASALLERSDMQVEDVVHRLRIRANTADEQGERHLAKDIRTAIQTITKMDEAAKSANRMSAIQHRSDDRDKPRFTADRRY
jgi:hypothetical protein